MTIKETSNSDQEQYDLVVIGGGLGGLTCACIFGMEGHKVCVLDKNKQIGGNLQTFSRDKVIFDSGVHYVGSLAPGQTLNKLFTYLGIMDKLNIRKMDEDIFDGIIFGDDPKIYRHAQGYDRFIANLVEDFPEEETAIRTYCDTIQNICNQFPLYNLNKNILNNKYSDISIDAKGFVDSLTQNIRLRNVLMGSNILYAGVAHKSPLYTHSLVANSYIESAYRFVNGGSQIARLLVKQIRGRGGIVKTRAKIKKLVEVDGRIKYAEDEQGQRYYGKNFISNLHPKQTLQLTNSKLIRNAYRTRINSLKNTISCFNVDIVLKKDAFLYRNSNYYYSQNNNVWEAVESKSKDWPLTYALFFPAPENGNNIYEKGISVLSYMGIEEVSPWANTFHTSIDDESRGEDYELFKKEKAEILISKVDKSFPGLKEAIKSYTCYTPLTLRDYIGTDDGSMYGVFRNINDIGNAFISPKTKIPNLFLTGQNLSMHGVLGVALNSVATSSEIFGLKYLIDKINGEK